MQAGSCCEIIRVDNSDVLRPFLIYCFHVLTGMGWDYRKVTLQPPARICFSLLSFQGILSPSAQSDNSCFRVRFESCRDMGLRGSTRTRLI
jgi:hypothetical protein